MRKFFTFVICALCAVSVWGSEVIIGSGDGTSKKYPLYPEYKYGLTQFIYLSTEIGSVTDASISKISFRACESGTYTRNISIYIEHTSSSDLSSGWIAVTSDPVFSGNVDVPDGGWYDIPLSTNFTWNQESNILVTICDNTNAAVGEWLNYKKHYVYSATNRGRASGNSSAKDPTKPSGGLTVESEIPQIKLYFEAVTPVLTPSIAVSGTKDVGVIDPAFETKDVVLTITGENLDKNVAIACAEGLSCTDTQIDKEDAMAEGGAQVTISTTSDFDVAGAKVTFTSGTATKEVTITGTAASYYSPTISATYFNYSNAIASPYFGYAHIKAFKLTISEVANNQFKPYNSATFTVDYSGVNIACAEAGKVSNLRGKFVSESEFKAFSFDYEAPELSAIVINENENNSDKWPEAAQSGKELLITRTIVPNEWNSIVLPTYLTSTEVNDYFGAGTDVEKFTNAVITSSNITLNFIKETNGLEAGVPYLIKPKQALPNNSLHLTNHSFTPTASTVTYDGIEFVGVLVPTLMDATGDDFIFVGSGNTLLHPSSAGTIKGMRAYFHVIGTEAKAAIRKSPMISLSTGSTTAMTLVKSDTNKAYKAIENGRIVIKANGKKVNVLGQTVK